MGPLLEWPSCEERVTKTLNISVLPIGYILDNWTVVRESLHADGQYVMFDCACGSYTWTKSSKLRGIGVKCLNCGRGWRRA